jgi:hypothetical protein
MKVEYKVHGVAKGMANVPTEVDGEPITASVPCLEVELVTVSQRHGNQTLRFIGSQMAEAEELYKPDAEIMVTFEAKSAPESEAKSEMPRVDLT